MANTYPALSIALSTLQPSKRASLFISTLEMRKLRHRDLSNLPSVPQLLTGGTNYNLYPQSLAPKPTLQATLERDKIFKY